MENKHYSPIDPARTAHLLTKLMEECAEVIQEAAKASIFGMQEVARFLREHRYCMIYK